MILRNLSVKLLAITLILLTTGTTAFAMKGDTIPVLRSKYLNARNDADKTELSFKLGDKYLTKQGELKADLDSALYFQAISLQLSEKNDDAEGKTKAVLLNGRILLEAGNKPKATQLMAAALKLAIDNHLLVQQGKCYEAQAQLYNNENDGIAHKIDLQKKAIDLFHQAGSKEFEATGLVKLADYCHMRGRGDEALGYLLRAIAIYNEIHYVEMQGVYNLTSNVYTQLGNYPQAIKYGLAAAQNAEKLGDNSLQLSSIYNHIGLTYYFLKQDKEALGVWNKGLVIARRYKDAGYIQTLMANMVTSYVRIKKYDLALKTLAEIEQKYPPTEVQMKLRIPYIYMNTLLNMDRVKDAGKYYQALLDYHQKLPADDANQTYLCSTLARYMFATKQYLEADKYLRESAKIDAGNYLLMSKNEWLWFRVDSALKNTDAAINHYKLFKTYSDSVFNADKANEIAALQIKFETDEKDKNITLLTKTNSLQADTIKKDSTIKLVIAGCVVLLLILVGVVYNRYRLKQRSNMQLQEQQEEINTQNEMLRKLLHEKEWLLKEIHHRVKNNLQIVISLLNTQSAYIDNQNAIEAIQNSQHRMHAMSLIHQKLYQSDSLATIDMSWYIRELISYMKECFDIGTITFQVDTDQLLLDVAQAVPLGLILNESITNAIKYAFPDRRTGTVSISLHQTAAHNYALVIADDGIGLPEGFDAENNNSLGMNLMFGLSAQLDGNLELKSENGLRITITFSVNAGVKF